MIRLRPVLAAVGAAGAALALAPAAGATLVYQRGTSTLSVWAAADDGSGAHRIATGMTPSVSPDGQTVAFGSPLDRQGDQTLRVVPAAGGPARTILRNWRGLPPAWSPDGRSLATTTGRQLGRQRLVIVDVATGATRAVATGCFSSASFSPDGARLVYGRAGGESPFARTDLSIFTLAGGATGRLTTGGHSAYPLWGPRQIVYVRWSRPTGKHRHEDGPKFHLWVIRADGSHRRQLTRGPIPFLLTGPVPTAWSADGSRLLAEYSGQDTSYAVTVNPVSGRMRALTRNHETGFAGTALSRDGSTVLGFTGGFEPTRRSAVVAMPYRGGRARVLARRAYMPDWSR
jgi:Tol biopolymer transport system component